MKERSHHRSGALSLARLVLVLLPLAGLCASGAALDTGKSESPPRELCSEETLQLELTVVEVYEDGVLSARDRNGEVVLISFDPQIEVRREGTEEAPGRLGFEVFEEGQELRVQYDASSREIQRILLLS